MIFGAGAQAGFFFLSLRRNIFPCRLICLKRSQSHNSFVRTINVYEKDNATNDCYFVKHICNATNPFGRHAGESGAEGT